MASRESESHKWSVVGRNWGEEGWSPIASELRADYTICSRQYAAKGGARDLKYQFLQGTYLLGFLLKHNLDERERFKADPYWHDDTLIPANPADAPRRRARSHEKPNERNIMRSVLNYVTNAKRNETLQSRNSKYGKVLESFYELGVIPDQIPQRLKDGGGIDFICESLPGRAHPAGETSAGQDASTYDAVPAETTDRTANEEGAVPTEDVRNGHIVTDGIGLSGDLTIGDLGRGELVAMPRATSDQSDVVGGEAAPSEPPKQGPLNVFDMDTEVVVGMGHQLEHVINSLGGLISFRVWPRDKRGWHRITGSIVSLDRGEDRSPDKPSGDDA